MCNFDGWNGTCLADKNHKDNILSIRHSIVKKKVPPIGRDSSRIDIVFDVYLDNSIKNVERNRRSCRELKLQQILPDAEIKQ